MYFVIHKSLIRPGKTLEELKLWMRQHDATLAKWGAVEADLYRPLFGESNLFFMRYKLKSIDQWHKAFQSPEGQKILESLGEVLDLSSTTIYVMEEIPY